MECGYRMKVSRSGLSCILILFCLPPAGGEEPALQDPAAPVRAQARVVLEVFTLPAVEAHELASQDLTGAVLHDRVLEAVRTGKASLDHLMALGEYQGRFTCQQHEDYLYPTEYDPPQLSQTLALISTGARTPRKPVREAPEAVVSPFNGGLGNMTTTTPTAFQTQPLGETLEVDLSWSDTGRLPVSYKFESHRLLTVDQRGDIPCPVFSPRKLEGSAWLRHGQPAFLGTCGLAKLSGAPGQRAEAGTPLAFLTAFAEPWPSPAEQREAESPFADRTLRCTVEVVSLDKAAARPLLLEQPADADVYHHVIDLVKSGAARRETALSVRAKAGLETVVENADDYEQPTEFDPPQVPQNLIIADKDLLRDLRSGSQAGLGAQPPVEGGNPNGGFGLITTLSPTAFQITPLGESLKINVTGEGGDLSALAALSITRLAGTVSYNGIAHPVFERRELSVRVLARPGRPVLLGTLNKAVNTGWPGSNQEDRIWLAFLRIQGG